MSVHRENAGREEHECVNLQDKRLDGSQCESKRERERERETFHSFVLNHFFSPPTIHRRGLRCSTLFSASNTAPNSRRLPPITAPRSGTSLAAVGVSRGHAQSDVDPKSRADSTLSHCAPEDGVMWWLRFIHIPYPRSVLYHHTSYFLSSFFYLAHIFF